MYQGISKIYTNAEYTIENGFVCPDRFDGDTDSEKLQNCYDYASENGLSIILNKPLNITGEVKFDKNSVLIIGNKKGDRTSGAVYGVCDLNITLPIKITKTACVTFYNVSFGGMNNIKNIGLIVGSFHVTFDNCFFFNFSEAIRFEKIPDEYNWIGENKILKCNFTYCDICINSVEGSDGFIDSCVFLGNSVVALKGKYGGFQITNNHFYSKGKSSLSCFNTTFNNNYIQEVLDSTGETIVSIEFTNISVMITNTKFELQEQHNNSSAKGIVSINLQTSYADVGNVCCFSKGSGQHSDNLFLFLVNYAYKFGGVLDYTGCDGLTSGPTPVFSNNRQLNTPSPNTLPTSRKYFGGMNGLAVYLYDYSSVKFTYAAICNVGGGFYIATWTENGVVKTKTGTGLFEIANYSIAKNCMVLAFCTTQSIETI